MHIIDMSSYMCDCTKGFVAAWAVEGFGVIALVVIVFIKVGKGPVAVWRFAPNQTRGLVYLPENCVVRDAAGCLSYQTACLFVERVLGFLILFLSLSVVGD